MTNLIVVVMFGLSLGCATGEEVNLVENGSFEDPVLKKNSPQVYRIKDQGIPAWTIFGEAGTDVAVINGDFGMAGLVFTHADGDQSLDLTGLANRVGGVQQSLKTVAGQRYRLEFALANVRSTGIWGTTSMVRVEIDGKGLMISEKKNGPVDRLAWDEVIGEFVATGAETIIGLVSLDGKKDCVNQIDSVKVTAMGETIDSAKKPEPDRRRRAAAAPAGEYQFWFNRFGAIFINVAVNRSQVEAFQEDKRGTHDVLFASKLSMGDDGVLRTPAGTEFHLIKLGEKVVNDGNRGINSGDWSLEMIGDGEEAAKIEDAVHPPAFGKENVRVYFGEKVK